MEALVAAGDLDEAVREASELVLGRPEDPSLRLLIGRVHLARGDGVAALAAFERARALGASEAELRIPIAESFLLQGRYQQVLEIVPLSVSRADLEPPLIDMRLRALLRTPLADPREIFLDARQRLITEAENGAESLEALLRENQVLFANAQHVRRALAHWACLTGEVPEAEPARLYQPTWANLSEEHRRILRVGPGRPYSTPSLAAAEAMDGDIIEIDAGTYVEDVAVWTASGLWIRAKDGQVVLDSRGATAEDMAIWLIRGNETVIEGIRFVGARGPHKNGSGIRLLGRDLWVRQSEFHDNEAGLLTFNEPGEVLVEHSILTDNGAADGQSHNVYVGRTDRLIFRFNYVAGSKNGHQIKSRARENHILYNRLADELTGTSSYTIDLPEGGYALVMGNELQQGPGTVNRHMVSLGTENPLEREHSFVFAFNTFYNHTFPATLIRDATGAGVTLINNVYAGAPAAMDSLITSEAGNAWNASSSLVDGPNGDYRLTSNSPLIDAGAAQPLSDVPASPAFEYKHPAQYARRRLVWQPDPGAHEFCGWPDDEK